MSSKLKRHRKPFNIAEWVYFLIERGVYLGKKLYLNFIFVYLIEYKKDL